MGLFGLWKEVSPPSPKLSEVEPPNVPESMSEDGERFTGHVGSFFPTILGTFEDNGAWKYNSSHLTSKAYRKYCGMSWRITLFTFVDESDVVNVILSSLLCIWLVFSSREITPEHRFIWYHTLPISVALASNSFVCISVVLTIGDSGEINRWRNSSLPDGPTALGQI